jgi:hypothetical protein
MALAAVLSAFVVAVIPAAIFMAVWTAVTVMRILFPEHSLPLLRNGVAERKAARTRGEAVGVGFREIHEDLRAKAREREREKARASEHRNEPVGRIPEAWIEDLYRRRN